MNEKNKHETYLFVIIVCFVVMGIFTHLQTKQLENKIDHMYNELECLKYNNCPTKADEAKMMNDWINSHSK